MARSTLSRMNSTTSRSNSLSRSTEHFCLRVETLQEKESNAILETLARLNQRDDADSGIRSLKAPLSSRVARTDHLALLRMNAT
jgi:hypothetical protein